MRRIPTWWQQPIFKEFRQAYSTNKQDALFFLGSGISIQAGLPNWRELLEGVLEKSAEHSRPLIDVHDLNRLYRKLTEKDDPTFDGGVAPLEKPKDIFNIGKKYYPEIGSFLKQKLDESGEEGAWRRILSDILTTPQIGTEKQTIHDAIVSLEWYGIVTTNYDTLIEDTYARVWPDKKPVTVARPGKNENSLDRRAQEKFIYKIHGDIRDPDSPLVITKEDYDAVYHLTVNTSTKANLRGVFRSAEVILFAGYSQDDETLINFYADAREHTKPGNAYALVPMEDSNVPFEEKIAQRAARTGIKYIVYSPEDDHRELSEFFLYLANPEEYDAVLNSRISARHPTVVMLYCGGTIGSSKPEAESIKDERPLTVTKIPSRFDPSLTEFSDRLLEWYEDTYNLGSNVKLDVKWEVMPEEYQVFSENATPELWNAILKKIEDVSFKYFRAPIAVGDDTFLKLGEDKHLSEDYQRVLALYNEENEEYKKFLNGDGDEEGSKSLSHIRFISDFQSRYVLGILLLTGTDTMSYLVSALSFGLQHGPCSMIVTGSNQPPDDSPLGKLKHLNKSDAWKNILAGFYFLQSFGHTLTDAFICFGDTIHHGVNVRKITSELGPVSSSLTLTREVEPFVFRNLHIRGQYMFRLIDGVFCNNYYPVGISYWDLVRSKRKDLEMRHIRRDPLQRHDSGRKKLERSCFCHNTAICHIPASPSPPLIDVKGMCASSNNTPLRLVILEGFASGTYPTQKCSNFEPLLYDLYKHAIPIVLISEYGISEKQQSYEVELVRDVHIPVILLSGLTIETALPVLALVVNEIKREDWGSIRSASKKTSGRNEKAEEMLQKRTKLIQHQLRSFYKERPNILTYEIEPRHAFGDQMAQEIEDAKQNLKRSENSRATKIQHRGTIFLDKFDESILRFYDVKPKTLTFKAGSEPSFKPEWSKDMDDEKRNSVMSEADRSAKIRKGGVTKFDGVIERIKSKYTFLYKRDFSLLVSEIARRDKSKGAGPDGYAALNDLGFEYGMAFVKAVTTNLTWGAGWRKLFNREVEEQEVLLTAAQQIVKDVTRLLTSTGVASVSADEERMFFPKPRKLEPGETFSEKQGFSFTIKSLRYERLEDTEDKEKFAAVSFSDEDARFFERLAHGCDSTKADDLERYYREVDNAYDEILLSKWQNRTSSLDWMLMGIFKGVTCGIADFLRFDDLAVKASGSKDKGSQYVFRKAAHCFVLTGDDKFFEIKLSYYESTTLLGNSSED
jgi:SIR2-like domain/Asparaginase, N-terminal